jgi:hypothetical protein
LVLAIPEGAIIDTGRERIAYRETGPGEYEGVVVELGPRMVGPGGVTFHPVLSGLAEGERVVTTGSFLIDAETRLNPAAGSIYFGGSGLIKSGPTSSSRWVRPSTPSDEEQKRMTALASLSPTDRRLAEEQGYCAVLNESRLGSMGPPVKLLLHGEAVFVCCKGCESQARANPEKVTEQAKELRRRGANRPPARATEQPPPLTAEERAAINQLPAADRAIAARQRICPVSQEPLGSMGVPKRFVVNGMAGFVCCEGCLEAALADPKRTTEALRALVGDQKAAEKREPASPEP